MPPDVDFEPRAASDLAAFFAPRAVAIFGASRERNKLGSEVLHNLIATGYQGQVFVIHPTAPEIQGMRAYASLGSAPSAADLAIVVVPAHHVDAVVLLQIRVDDPRAARLERKEDLPIDVRVRLPAELGVRAAQIQHRRQVLDRNVTQPRSDERRLACPNVLSLLGVSASA